MAQFGSAQALAGIHAVGAPTNGRCTTSASADLRASRHPSFLRAGRQGKWMFEVTLVTAGVQQLGWATASTPFTHEARPPAPAARSQRR